MSDNPNPNKEPSLLAQTFQLIGNTTFQLFTPPVRYNGPMWQAAAYLTTSEYAACLRLKREWANGTR